MPLNADIIGLETEPYIHEVDARWLMAYAAGLGDDLPCYLDTLREGGIVGHPLFPICPEWPVALASRELFRARGLTADELARAVHASHDTHVHRLVRPDDVLSTQVRVMAISALPAGTLVTERFDTRDAVGELVARSYHGMILRGVTIDGAPKGPVPANWSAPAVPERQSAADSTVERQRTIPVGPHAAHIYSECARIWNPIHTDLAVARAAGLPDLILHGSATLALAVSAIIEDEADGDPRRVRRLGGQFRAMVLMPGSLSLKMCAFGQEDGAKTVHFELVTDSGKAAIKAGFVTLA